MSAKLIHAQANFGFSTTVGFQFGAGDEATRYGVAFAPGDTEETIAEALTTLVIALRHKQPVFLRTDAEVSLWERPGA